MKAVFNMRCKVKSIGELPPNIKLKLFDALIKPILIYGSDVWGINQSFGAKLTKYSYDTYDVFYGLKLQQVT